MANLTKHPTAARLTAGDLGRIRSWAIAAREQFDGAWGEDDASLLTYIEDHFIASNAELEDKLES